MAVILLNQGKLAEVSSPTMCSPKPLSRTPLQAISVLEKVTYRFPATAVSAEPFLFNLGLLAFPSIVVLLLSDFSGISDAL